MLTTATGFAGCNPNPSSSSLTARPGAKTSGGFTPNSSSAEMTTTAPTGATRRMKIQR